MARVVNIQFSLFPFSVVQIPGPEKIVRLRARLRHKNRIKRLTRVAHIEPPPVVCGLWPTTAVCGLWPRLVIRGSVCAQIERQQRGSRAREQFVRFACFFFFFASVVCELFGVWERKKRFFLGYR